MVPMLVVFYDAPAVYSFYSIKAVNAPDLTLLFLWVGGFSLFAFLTTLSREIIKDIEDYDGDIEYGRKTLPVVLGIKSTKSIVISLQAITIITLYVVLILFIRDIWSYLYLSVAVVIPLLLVVFLLVVSKTKVQLHFVSRLMKITMIAGILYSVIVKYIIS
jgi:4-hydroxybenzoate polyprenyltransferase